MGTSDLPEMYAQSMRAQAEDCTILALIKVACSFRNTINVYTSVSLCVEVCMANVSL